MSDGRLSPGALERRMTAELNLWHGMDVSMAQVSNVEKSRAVTMAQQESVSMAQILKARQQAHEQEIKALGHRAKQEALETSRQIEESRRKATDATHNAAQVISQVRQGHDVSSLQESTQKLIETQAQAAQATAQAAKQLAEVRIYCIVCLWTGWGYGCCNQEGGSEVGGGEINVLMCLCFTPIAVIDYYNCQVRYYAVGLNSLLWLHGVTNCRWSCRQGCSASKLTNRT